MLLFGRPPCTLEDPPFNLGSAWGIFQGRLLPPSRTASTLGRERTAVLLLVNDSARLRVDEALLRPLPMYRANDLFFTWSFVLVRELG